MTNVRMKIWKYKPTKTRIGRRPRRHWNEDSKVGTEAKMRNPWREEEIRNSMWTFLLEGPISIMKATSVIYFVSTISNSILFFSSHRLGCPFPIQNLFWNWILSRLAVILGRGIDPSQGIYIFTGQHSTKIVDICVHQYYSGANSALNLTSRPFRS
jgi:hypothetical protein